jgi:hypothetical protein
MRRLAGGGAGEPRGDGGPTACRSVGTRLNSVRDWMNRSVITSASLSTPMTGLPSLSSHRYS